MADPLDIFRQREWPSYFVQPSTPPRDIRSLSSAELDSYLRGFSSPPLGNEPPASPYSAQDLRLELARRGSATRRMDDGFEDARISNPPTTMPIRPATARPTGANAPSRIPGSARPAATNQTENPPPPSPAPDPALFLAQQAQARQPQQPSVLDMLRGRMAREMESEDLRRIGEFGAGMLASGSPNFFTMLGAGARAAREGDVSRLDQLRRFADLERQDAAQRAEEARRQEELRIRDEEQRFMAPYRAALTEQALATAADIRSGRGRGMITVAQRLQAERDAVARARIAHPDLPLIPPPTAAQQAELQRLREAYIARELPRLLEAAANPSQAPAAAPSVTSAPAAPAAVIDLRRNPGGTAP